MVSDAPDLFLGLVTHPTSTFNRDNRAGSMLEQLVQELANQGLTVDYLVSDRNGYSPEEFPVTRDSLIKSAIAQSKLERDWRDFVNRRSGITRTKEAQSQGLYLAMRTKRTFAALGGKDSMAGKAYRRLINIDLSHQRVLTEGINSGARGLVVLEDDALMPDKEMTQDLARILVMARDANIDFINLSQSISAPKLGIEGILTRAKKIDVGRQFSVIELDTPITNTVCANYYSNSFAKKFQQHISRSNLVPVKPIDWRLNEMMLSNPDTCTWWVQPGIFIQGSMHTDLHRTEI